MLLDVPAVFIFPSTCAFDILNLLLKKQNKKRRKKCLFPEGGLLINFSSKKVAKVAGFCGILRPFEANEPSLSLSLSLRGRFYVNF